MIAPQKQRLTRHRLGFGQPAQIGTNCGKVVQRGSLGQRFARKAAFDQREHRCKGAFGR